MIQIQFSMCIEKDNDLMLSQKQMGLSTTLHELMIAIYLEENFSMVFLEGTGPR